MQTMGDPRRVGWDDDVPQRLKPAALLGPYGAPEVAPLQNLVFAPAYGTHQVANVEDPNCLSLSGWWAR